MSLAIDISNNNKTVDVAALKKAHPDLSVLGVKRGEGASYVDAYFDSNFRQGAAAGLVVVPYYFARPEAQPGMVGGDMEASQFYAELKGHGYFSAKMCGRLALDYETVKDVPFANAFAHRIRKLVGSYPIIYCSGSKVAEIDNDPTLRWLDLWVADYGTAAQKETYVKTHKGRVVMWQYTDKLDGKFDASIVYVHPSELQLHPTFRIEEVLVGGKAVLSARLGHGRVRRLLHSGAFLKAVGKFKNITIRRVTR